MNIQKALIEFIVATLVLVGVYFYGWNSGETYERESNNFAQAELDKKTVEKYNEIAQQLEDAKNARQETTRTIVKKVDKIITRVVYNNVCIDADGLQLINSALASSAAPNLSITALQEVAKP